MCGFEENVWRSVDGRWDCEESCICVCDRLENTE